MIKTIILMLLLIIFIICANHNGKSLKIIHKEEKLETIANNKRKELYLVSFTFLVNILYNAFLDNFKNIHYWHSNIMNFYLKLKN